jgi:uncharacterized YigZ family protein
MLFDDTYLTIASPSSGEYRDRGSKFIGFAYPVKSEEEVKQHIQHLRKEHPQANHHCSAFRLSPDPTVFRASDDREPSGSAGKPILGAITSKGLTDVLVVVVRYFGGTLLGVPGLINAYRTAAAAALDNATIKEELITEQYAISFSYDLMNDVHHFLRQFPVKIKSQEFEDPCRIIFDIRKSAALQIEAKIKDHPSLSYQAELEHL